MNSLFKKFVHPQDSLLQFVTQYDYIMDTRVERENVERCKGEISDPPLWGRYEFEKQAAEFYTCQVFSKFQLLLRDSTSFRVSGSSEDENGCTIQVIHPKGSRVRTVTVDKEKTEFTCSCNMFDRDGLLCTHILKVFTNRDIEQIPAKYLLKRWSKEAIINVPEHLSGPEPSFGVPMTNKLRYNSLCRMMTSLAADACLCPEQYSVVSAGVKKMAEGVRSAMGAAAVANVAAARETEAATVLLKNPPKAPRKGRPKEKVERLKSVVMQAREKAMKRKGAGENKTKKKG